MPNITPLSPVAIKRVPAFTPGGLPGEFTSEQIEQRVAAILRMDASNERRVVLELLHEFGVLSMNTLFELVNERVVINDKMAAFVRQLSRYRSDGLVADLDQGVALRAFRGGDMGVREGQPIRALQLGPVGAEYARRKGWGGDAPLTIPVDGNRLAHDLVCAEAMLQIKAAWPKWTSPALADVYGPRKLVVWDAQQRRVRLAPDGMIVKRGLDGEFQRAFLIEYHHADTAGEVQEKVQAYEEIGKSEHRELWREAWGLEGMPMILALYRDPAIIEYYQAEINKLASPVCSYGVMSLSDVWAGKLALLPIRKKGG